MPARKVGPQVFPSDASIFYQLTTEYCFASSYVCSSCLQYLSTVVSFEYDSPTKGIAKDLGLFSLFCLASPLFVHQNIATDGAVRVKEFLSSWREILREIAETLAIFCYQNIAGMKCQWCTVFLLCPFLGKGRARTKKPLDLITPSHRGHSLVFLHLGWHSCGVEILTFPILYVFWFKIELKKFIQLYWRTITLTYLMCAPVELSHFPHLP